MLSRRSRVQIVSLLVSLMSTAITLVAVPAPQQPARDVERVVMEFLAAFGNRDFAQFVPLFSEDATMFVPPSNAAPTGRVSGRAEIERTFRAIFDKYPPRSSSPTPLRPQDLLVEAFDGFAVVTFHLGSEPARQRRTLVMRRLRGDWKIVHLHGSASGTQP